VTLVIKLLASNRSVKVSNLHKLSLGILWLFVTLGTYGAISVSYSTFTNISPCPSYFGLPICYVVLLGYLMMLSSLFRRQISRNKKVFYYGWLIVFLIAMVGTFLEFVWGDICPKGFHQLPLCFVSLAFTIVFLLLHTLVIKYENTR
jgi:hypothetical protein